MMNGYKRSTEAREHASVGRGAFRRRRRCGVSHAGAFGKANVGISNDKEGEKPSRGFLNNDNRFRVSRGLRISRKAKPMDRRLIFRHPAVIRRRDGEVKDPRTDGYVR